MKHKTYRGKKEYRSKDREEGGVRKKAQKSCC